jgi:anti-sigma regulatory factor (Ser/Thr protein kinase)
MPGGQERESVLHITSATAELGRLYPWLESAGPAQEVPADLMRRLHVVLEEAVANVAMHAYPAGQPGEITVRLRGDPSGVVLEVEDAGVAFDPTAAPQRPRAATLPEATPGGWGLGLIRHYCSDIAYQRLGGRNVLTLRFPPG